MEAVGIKEFRTHLSEYIAKAQAGKRLIVTDRGKEVAELIPASKERRSIKKLVKKGRMAWNGKKPSGLTGVTILGKPLSDTVIEERR